MYEPDSWVIVEVPDSETGTVFHKVLGGWSGGYLDGDTWRLNSGITKVEAEDDMGVIVFYLTGHSGSKYSVRETGYGLRMSTVVIAKQLVERGCKILNESEAMRWLHEQDSGQV